MKKNVSVYLVFSFLLFGLLLVGKASAQANPSCYTPGTLVVTDPENDATLAQNDIQSVSIAEPFYSDGSQKLVVTLKIKNLYSLPVSSWNVFIKGQDNVVRFLQMSNLLGNLEYRYGTLGSLLGVPVFNYEGSLQGTYETDGTVTFIVNKSAVGNLSNGQLINVYAYTYTRVAVDLVEVDGTAISNYTIAGNGTCTPYKFLKWGTNGDIPVANNYFRNEVDDFAVWRPETGVWYSTDALTNSYNALQVGSGAAGDIPVPGNYDRDGKADFAVYRPSNGTWYIQKTELNALQTIQFGAAGDIPMAADFDGDRIDDLAVYRPSTGVWYILNSSDSSVRNVAFGTTEDRPVAGDYDGDRKADVAVFRPSNGAWYILQSSTNTLRAQQFGVGTDTTVQADYDGDGKTDIAVWRPEGGAWYVLRSSTNSYTGFQWGLSPDRVQPGDYNGNGRADYAVWRPETGIWYVYMN